MQIRQLAPLSLLLAALAVQAHADQPIEGTYRMATQAMGVTVSSTTVELTPQYIREGDNRLAIAEWLHEGGYLTARDSRGNTLLHARIEDGGDTLIQQIEGIGTATFTRID
ncbi:hypothetical protein NGA35_04170 [Pseudomonas stutzeri]|nr:hypothetical protein [Stutzerimonas stutzeri]